MRHVLKHWMHIYSVTCESMSKRTQRSCHYIHCSCSQRTVCVILLHQWPLLWQILHCSHPSQPATERTERARRALETKTKKKKKWRTESRLCFGFPVYGAKAGSRSYIDNMDPSVTLMVKCLITLLQHRPSSVLVQDKGLVSFCMNYTLSQKWNCHTWGKARH